MSIRYKFVPIYDNLNEEGEKVTGFYPKVVSRGTIGKERMFDDISRGSSSLRAELARSWMLMAMAVMMVLFRKSKSAPNPSP